MPKNGSSLIEFIPKIRTLFEHLTLGLIQVFCFVFNYDFLFIDLGLLSNNPQQGQKTPSKKISHTLHLF